MLFAILALTQESASAVRSVSLQWELSPSPGVAGYYIYYGTESGVYPQRLTLDDVGMATIPGLEEGVTYYFVVTAFDESGDESEPSNEVPYTVPGGIEGVGGVSLNMQQLQVADFPKSFAITATGQTPAQWALEASEDLRTWHTVTVGTNSSPNITVLVSSTESLLFRLRSNVPGVALATRKPPGDSVPNSFFITTEGDTPPEWTLETTRDLWHYAPFTSGTNVPLNVVVIASKAPAMFFRLRGR